MIKNILTAAGIEFRQTRFPSPPAGTYAVYMDDVSTDGPDYINLIYTHDYTIEVYPPTADDADAAEQAIEAALNAARQRWTKQDRHWLQSERRYQVIYEFTYREKRRA